MENKSGRRALTDYAYVPSRRWRWQHRRHPQHRSPSNRDPHLTRKCSVTKATSIWQGLASTDKKRPSVPCTHAAFPSLPWTRLCRSPSPHRRSADRGTQDSIPQISLTFRISAALMVHNPTHHGGDIALFLNTKSCRLRGGTPRHSSKPRRSLSARIKHKRNADAFIGKTSKYKYVVPNASFGLTDVTQHRTRRVPTTPRTPHPSSRRQLHVKI